MYDQIDIEKNKILSDSVMRYFVAEVSICRNLQYDLEKMLAVSSEYFPLCDCFFAFLDQ